MSPVSTVPSASRLQNDILRTILYFDIFRHPLRVEEIYRFLPSNSTSPDEVAAACADRPLNLTICEDKGFYFLKSQEKGSDPVRERLEKESRARAYWRVAKLVASVISPFPFVRGVFISGELSKGVASRHGEIDFFIVTADRRLWITGSLLVAFKKIFLLNQKKFLCLNHFVAQSYLDVEARNIYTALEIATLRPLYNPDLFLAYLRHNSWVGTFLPNAGISASRQQALPPARRSMIQKMFEVTLQGRWGDIIDNRLMHFWKLVWDKRYHHLPAEKRSSLFQCRPHISTAYAGDFLSGVLGQYRKRLSAHGFNEEEVLLP